MSWLSKTWKQATSFVSDVASTIINVVEKTVQVVGSTIKAIVKNPLPTIATIALTWALGPSGLEIASEMWAPIIASASITAAQGGDFENIAKAATFAWAGQQAGQYAGQTFAGSEVAGGAEAVGGGADWSKVSNLSSSTVKTLTTISASAVGASTSSTLTALSNGKSFEDALKIGLTAGATAGLTTGVGVKVGEYVQDLSTAAGVDKFAKDMGIEKFTDATKRAVTRAVTAGALGKDPSAAAVQSYASAANQVINSKLSEGMDIAGNTLKTSYEETMAKQKALEATVAEQKNLEATVSQLSKDENFWVNQSKNENNQLGYERAIQRYNLAVQNGDQAGADKAAAEANDYARAAEATVTQAEAKLAPIQTQLVAADKQLQTLYSGYDTQLKDLETTRTNYVNAVTGFSEAEKNNADKVANLYKSSADAQKVLQENLGEDITADQLAQFFDSGDVTTAAQQYVDSRNQESKDAGFASFLDQKEATAQDFGTADEWNNYKNTSGIVASAGKNAGDVGVSPVGETETGVASLLKNPDQFGFENNSGQESLISAPVQLAAYTPTNTQPTSDTEIAPIGLSSLSNQPSTPLPSIDVQDIVDRGGFTVGGDDLSSVTGKTSQAPPVSAFATPQSVTEKNLGANSETGVRLGGSSDATYTGKDNTVTASADTLTNKYFGEPTPDQKALGDIGLGGIQPTAKTKTASEEVRENLASGPVGTESKATKAALGEKKDLTATETALQGLAPKGKKMDYDDDFAKYQDYGSGTSNMEDFIQQQQAEQRANQMEALRTSANNNDSAYDGIVKSTDDDELGYLDKAGFNIDADTMAYPLPDGSYRLVNTVTGGESIISAEQYAAMTSGKGSPNANTMANQRGPTTRGNYGGTEPGFLTKAGNAASNFANSITSNPKALAAAAGAAAAYAGRARGATPMGLRSLQAGAGKQLSQTGAKGTKGRGSVRYFERKAVGGEVGLGYLHSAQDGMKDKINATIDNKRPAKLSGGEFVIPADVVSHLGNGNSNAGAQQLYALMEKVRKARTGTPNQGKQIDPKKYLPK